MGNVTIAQIIAFVGDRLSQGTQAIIQFVAQYGINFTKLDAQLLLILLLGVGVYLIISLIAATRKILKWGLIVGFIFLIISTLASIFAK